MVYAVYAEVADATNMTPGVSSIKFGSWDQYATLETGSTDITMFRTVSLDGWFINANKFFIDDVSFLPAGATRRFDINTHLPFIYMPDADWVMWEELMNKNYKSLGLVCSKS